MSEQRWRKRAIRHAASVATAVILLGVQAAPASAGLLDGLVGGLVGTTMGLVDGVLSIVTSGWDDGATTPPVRMDTVADAVGADNLWAAGVDGTGVGVAMIDTGVVPVQGLSQAGKVVNGPDLSFDSQVKDLRYLDGFGHGTHMAGIIAGNDGTATGFRGIAPGARLLNVRVGAHDGAVDVSQVIAAIDWVVQHRNDAGLNIRVLNLAFGTDGVQAATLDPLAHAVEQAWRHGIVVVVAGGNEGSSRSLLVNPATNRYVLAVGAADLHATASVLDDTVAPFSSRTTTGRTVDLVAPGVSITSLRDPGSVIDEAHPSAVVDTRFFRGSGTSQATAVTAGAAALLLDARPALTPDQVKALLTSTATPLADVDLRAQGAGRLDVYRASYSPVPLGSTQQWTASAGTGLLELARGSSHVADDGVELTGERDIMSMPWVGSTWAPLSATASAWNGGKWNGAEWTGKCWCSTSWAGASWTGRSWTGRTWSGRTWSDSTWTGRTWSGRTWSGGSWSGRSWTGSSWTGRTWT